MTEVDAEVLDDGTKRWARRYDGPQGDIVDIAGIDRAHDLGVSPDGTTVFVTGSIGSGNVDDYATVAYETTGGTKLWASIYDGPNSDYDEARALAVSPDGATVFVTGTNPGSGYDFATVAYRAA